MIVKVELLAGRGRKPTKKEMDKNIAALKKAKKGEHLSVIDELLINDSISILEGIKRGLP